VLVNNRYAARLGAGDGAARQFVSEMSASANWLVRSLEQRARTILKVAGALTVRQAGFFDAGPSGLRPLTQRTIAEAVSLHESTVSRAAAGKFFACEHGTFEMRYLFNAAIQSVDGGAAFASAAVQDRIKALVAQEPRTLPLSDDKIVTALAEEGIDIARRTVAKYREALGIPSSVERRRRRTGFTRI
jgi:RNA polymerase sigma-54 factor